MKLLDPLHHSKVWVKLGKIFQKKMSVTSSATASGDWEVPSTNILRDRLCLISITKTDGTPMDASSISEEDIVEICMKKGHTHPLGMLCYLAMESIVLFSTTEDLKCASHGLVDVTELQNDAITVVTWAPVEAHKATFIMVWHSKPTTGDGEPHHSSHNNLPQVGEHCIATKQSLVTSMTTSCGSLWKT